MKLSLRLRQASHDLHAVAEKSGLMPLLLRSQLSGAHYAVFVRHLQAIYAALEQGLSAAVCPPGFDFSPLLRSRALARDLAFLAPPTDTPLCPAACDYVQRLQQLAAARSPLLMAHAYVRYLGDLHGGQALRRCVARLLPGDGIEGLHFYDFGPPERVAGLIVALRHALDSLALDAQQLAAMEQEVRLGFGLHIELFQQLPHAPAGAPAPHA